MCENDPDPVDQTDNDALATAACRNAYDELLQHCASEEPTNEDLTLRLPALKSAFEHRFATLAPSIKSLATKVAKRFPNCVDVDEFQQLALIHVYKKIAKFKAGNFPAWLNTVLTKLALSECRKKNIASGRELPLDLTKGFEPGIEHEFVDATVPITVSSHQLQTAFDQYWYKSKQPMDRYKAMFVNAAGFTQQLNQRQLDLLSDFARPMSNWEVQYRNAIERCNIVVFDWTDAHAMEYWQEQFDEDHLGEASLAALEAEYASKLKNNRGIAAQTLLRHYYKFLLIDAFWEYAFRGVHRCEPTDADVSSYEVWSYRDWTALMSLDGWIGSLSANAWKTWMKHAGIDNDINNNFCRVFSFPPISPQEKGKVNFNQEETRSINATKLKEIQRWLETSYTLSLSDAPDQQLNAYARTLMSIGAAHRTRVEIPLPWIGKEVQ